MPVMPGVTKRTPPTAKTEATLRFHPALWLAFAITILVAIACGAADPPSSPANAIPPATETSPLPLPTLRPVPTATPPPQTCDPVPRARLTKFEEVSLPASPPFFEDDRNVFLPAAWVIADGAAVHGTSAVYQCAAPESGPVQCPDNAARKCVNTALHVDWVPDIGAPKDHTRVNTLASLAGKPFEILVDTADVEFFASTLVQWTDEITSGFGPEATKLSPKVTIGDGTRLYEYPPLPERTPNTDYLLTIRLEFSGDNEITYLWRIPG